jgi:hypothetical protein
MKKKKLILWLAICSHAIVMLVFTFYLMKLPWLAGDEKFLIWATSAVKFASREVPPSEDFALINTSYDPQLIDRLDDFGFPVGQRVITDRAKLATLLDIISKAEQPPKYIICDIHFLDQTEADSSLNAALASFDNIILSYHLNKNNQPEYPIFKDINRGLSDYVLGSIFDGVYKYQLVYNDSLLLTPLKVHLASSGDSLTQMGPLMKVGDTWTTNNFVMNYRLLQKDIENVEAGFNPISMGELLYLEDTDIQAFTANKILVIGDFFEGDMHETLFEITAGPLILVNAYLSIMHGDTFVNVWFFILVIAVYLYLSYMVFVEGDYMEALIIRKFGAIKIASYLAGFMSYLFILTLLSLATFFIFNIHLNIFLLAVGFYLMDKVVGFVRRVV